MPDARPTTEVIEVYLQDQGGGETHSCPDCGEVLPTEQELDQHRQREHGGASAPAQHAIDGVTGE